MLRVIPVSAVAALRSAVMVLALSLGVPLLLAHEASAQSACTAKCKGDTACFDKCVQARKSRPQTRSTNPNPSTSTANPAKEDWKGSIFDSTHKGGGGGGGGGY
jgi:hypothetical protein